VLREKFVWHLFRAAERVLKGEFKRGAGQLVSAAIWTCDLRGFTTLADTEPLETVLTLLDEYFECVADPFVEAGGEVLNISGDAVLGVFPIGNDPSQVCTRALDAARLAFSRAREFNEHRVAKSLPTIHFGVSLHVGDVMLGNIGASGRLDFTIIGTAVNTACRLESKCKELGSPMLTTEAFFTHLDGVPARELGKIPLRGISDDVKVFALDAFVDDQSNAQPNRSGQIA
jgi:adenylate cyclase